MNTVWKRLAAASAMCLTIVAVAQAVETEVSDMDDLLRAKVAKHKAKQTSMNQSVNASSADAQNEAGSCGGVDIGNSVGAKPGRAPKEIVVVITGDVVNANNKCKQ